MIFNKKRPNTYLTLSLGIGLSLLSHPALASTADDIFGSTSPIEKLVSFMTGPLAFMIVIIGIVVMGGMLIFGNDLSGFGRRIMLLVLGGGLVLGAVQVVGALFATSTSGAIYEAAEDPTADVLLKFTTTEVPR
jgi:type IV secretory pathway VirB2 component (pilin)